MRLFKKVHCDNNSIKNKFLALLIVCSHSAVPNRHVYAIKNVLKAYKLEYETTLYKRHARKRIDTVEC